MSDYIHTGWSSEDNNIPEEDILKNILTDKLVYACWEKVVVHVDPDTGEILDTWEQINEAMGDGTYKEKYSIGNFKYINFGSTYGESVPVEIVAFDTDTKTSGGTAPITWICKDTLKGTYQWNSSGSNASGYPQSNLKTIIENAGASITGDDNPKLYIIDVNKTYRMGSGESERTDSSSFTYWAPSVYEIGTGYSNYDYYKESSGVVYTKFSNDNSRKKTETEGSSIVYWWLRSARYNNKYGSMFVDPTGFITGNMTTDNYQAVLGFCTDYISPSMIHTVTFKDGDQILKIEKVRGNNLSFIPTKNNYTFLGWSLTDDNTPDTINITEDITVYACWKKRDPQLITDTWAEIHQNVQDGTYKDKYVIGDWKIVNFSSTYGTNVPVEIIAFDTDDMTNGSKAPITWLTKNAIDYQAAWKATGSSGNYTSGGYPSSDLKRTIDEISWAITGDRPTNVVSVYKTYRKAESSATSRASYTYWVPSLREINDVDVSNPSAWGYEYIEDSGCVYTEMKLENRKKLVNGDTYYATYWLRTAIHESDTHVGSVNNYGNWSSNHASNKLRIVLGFCTG